MYVVRENMEMVGVTEEDTEDRVRWRRVIHRCGDPKREHPKEQEDYQYCILHKSKRWTESRMVCRMITGMEGLGMS